MSKSKKILDACCGSKMCWFDKNNPIATFVDNRQEEHILCDGRKLEINPDVLMDFRNLNFPDNHFSLVLFDPPHLKQLGKTSWMAKKYGVLGYHWRDDISQGFKECFRVLKKDGVLIFKWNESQIKLKEILELCEVQPVFGHTSGKNGLTHWICFLKS